MRKLGDTRIRELALMAFDRRRAPASLIRLLEPLELDVVARLTGEWGTMPAAPFQRAGWLFARRVRRKAEESRYAHRVYQYRDSPAGQLAIGLQRLYIEFRPGQAPRAMKRWLDGLPSDLQGLKVVDRLRFESLRSTLFTLAVPERLHPFRVAARLMRVRSKLEYAEPAVIDFMPSRSAPGRGKGVFAEGWHLDDIRARSIRKSIRGRGVTIAVIDHGFALDVPRLFSKISRHAAWQRVGSHKVLEHVADAGSLPDDGHGTFCASVAVGQAMRGHRRWRGVAPQADLLPVALTSEVARDEALWKAICYAKCPQRRKRKRARCGGADVISCSIESPARRAPLQRALRDAASGGRAGRGIPILWAVENGDVEPLPRIDDDPICRSAWLIPVGAGGRKCWDRGGATGPELAFLAPGFSVYGACFDGQIVPDDGTSYATPIAAAVAVLMLQVNPKLSRDRLIELLRRSCRQIPGVPSTHQGSGRIDARRAVELAAKSVSAPVSPAATTLFAESTLSEMAHALRARKIKVTRRDGLLVVHGDLDLSNEGLTELPDLSMVKVQGDFRCDWNQLTSLKGAPREVGGGFWCNRNLLKSLNGAPTAVGGGFNCNNNRLRSLKGAPREIGKDGGFSCEHNKLVTYEWAPRSFRALCSDRGTFSSWGEVLEKSPATAQRVKAEEKRLDAEAVQKPIDSIHKIRVTFKAKKTPGGASTAE